MRFDSLPLSRRTLQGLSQAKLDIATDIQAAAIPHALAGRDILGAAKTGSGKTLAFVVPMIEKLYRARWSTDDGLAAIIITPTRELALQIFEVIRIVGKKHQLSAGLVTGGKKEFEGEQERIVKMNILVATPGRLLQHFEQTSGFDASQLLVLVLDEADRILDMGFKHQLDSIISYLPTYRQTMLFSATQTKSVKDLARLSLNDPEYLAVHAEDKEVTPKQLVQNYIVTPLPEKLNVLFSFIRSHIQSKMIIFFSTCSQVRFVYECFRSMKPGITMTALHGKIKQDRRTLIYMDFLKRPSACMLATDIAARGLDFPNVDWVIQVDAPEDAAMYIHRVGRTARYNANGRALLLLMPQEEDKVVKVLEDATIPIKKLTVNPKQKFSVAGKAAALLAAFPEYRNYAKKAFTGYLRSLQMLPLYPMKDVKSLPIDEFATSLGLPFTPEVPVLLTAQIEEVRDELRGKKNVNRALDKLKKQIKEAKEAKKKAREEAKKNGTIYISESSGDESEEDLLDGESKKKKKEKTKKSLSNAIPKAKKDEDEEDDFLQVKKVHDWALTETAKEDETEAVIKPMDVDETEGSIAVKTKPTKMKINKEGKLKVKDGQSGKKVVFDEEGNEVDNSFSFQTMKNETSKEEIKSRIEEYAQKVKSKVDKGREDDIMREKQRLRELRLKRKQALKSQDDENGGSGPVAMLSDPVEEVEHSDSSDDDDNDDDRSGFSSDSSSESDGESGSDDEMFVRAAGVKRQRPSSSSEEESDSSDDDSEEDDSDSELDQKKLRDQEQLALALLDGKKPRTR